MEHVEAVRPDPVVQASIQPAVKPPAKSLVVFGIIFGILLPLAALTFELLTHAWASLLFDPFPTIWHVLLFASIAAGNGLWRGESSAVPCGVSLAGAGKRIDAWGGHLVYPANHAPPWPFALLAILFTLLYPRLFCLASSPYARSSRCLRPYATAASLPPITHL